MRAVWSWLLDLVELDREVSAEEGARALTAAGLEVESTEQVGHDFRGVVIAEVAAKRPHPDSDHLTLVDLLIEPGGTPTEVVCGAPNVPEPGGRVLWGRPGAVLPGNFELGRRKIRGVESAGMICSEKELGLGEDHDGIIVLGPADAGVPLGADAATALGLRDVVFEVGVPANRPDCLGHLGLARELAAAIGGRVKPAPGLPDELVGDLEAAALAEVTIEDPDACGRYVARIIDGVTVGRSPEWMRARLRGVGVRPLSNLVDVTNYVMFELGQPLHAFDYDAVRGHRIVVRRAAEGERMKTLDEVERQLTAADLLICDGEGPVALAGVMGGLESEVRDTTSRVLLEAASFAPIMVRRTARRLGLHSESSHRFERQVDPELAERASQRASELLARLGGGRIARGAVDVYPRPARATIVTLRASRTQMLTGVDVSRDDIATSLARLGLDSEVTGDDTLSVTCPTWRPDLSREVDLIEEVIRLHGYDKVPATLPRNPVTPTRRVDARPLLARRALVGAGLSEAITFGFTSPARIEALRFADGDRRAQPVALLNPMSVDKSVMRTSLLSNLLGAVARNLKYDVPDVGLFEIGSIFLPRQKGELPDEPVQAAVVLAGRSPGWLRAGAPVDFYDLKGILERMLDALLGARAADVRFEATAGVSYLHPGVAAKVMLGDTLLGHVGEVHPETRTAFELDVPCFAFEIDLAAMPAPSPRQMSAIARFPAVTRDVSFFVDAGVPAGRVGEIISQADEPLVERVTVLEDFRDPAYVPAGKKGMLWSVTYRSSEKTLTDKEVDKAHEAIVSRLLKDLQAERR